MPGPVRPGDRVMDNGLSARLIEGDGGAPILGKVALAKNYGSGACAGSPIDRRIVDHEDGSRAAMGLHVGACRQGDYDTASGMLHGANLAFACEAITAGLCQFLAFIRLHQDHGGCSALPVLNGKGVRTFAVDRQLPIACCNADQAGIFGDVEVWHLPAGETHNTRQNKRQREDAQPGLW